MSRILFLVSSMQGGGAERVAALLCNHWVEQGHEVTLMPTFSGRGECLYRLDERVSLDYLADRVGSRSRGVFNKLRRLITLRKVIRETGPDVIVSFLPHVNVAAVVAAWGLGIPVVVSERTFPPAMPLGRPLELLRRFTYSRATCVVVQTQRALEWLERSCPRALGRVIPNPVVYPLPSGTPVLEPASVIAGAKHLVLAVGRLAEEKGLDQLIAAFELIASQYLDWDLVILGDGPERENLGRQMARLGLNNRIHLPGRVGNVGDWYTRADIYVMSSRFEGFPNTLVEAMAHGLPAVSFNCDTGPADIIRDGIDGNLVSPADGEEGLARVMAVMIQDNDRRQRMGKSAVTVRDRFSPERVIAEWNVVLGLRKASGDIR